jgi:limonene-1,2-epoxide hydrolase
MKWLQVFFDQITSSRRRLEMKGRMLVPALASLAVMVLILTVRQAQAGIEPVLAVNHIFAALSSGDVDTAADSFAEDAMAENLVRKETYSGESEIRQMLQRMQREGRRYDIVGIQMSGDTITAKVEVSDRGFVWGTETIEAVVKDGRLQTFTVTDFRLELWRIHR